MQKLSTLLIICVLHSCIENIVTDTLYTGNVGQSNQELILNERLKSPKKDFLGILLVPYIICFFATTGIWPRFPQSMQASVNEMGREIFSQNDDRIRNFCKGKLALNYEHPYEPVLFKDVYFPPFDVATTAAPITEVTRENSSTTEEMVQSSYVEIKQPTNPVEVLSSIKSTTEATTITTEATTITTEATTATIEATTTTTEATTTTTEAATTTTEEATTTEAITTTTEATTTETTTTDAVITFNPITPICNCSYPQSSKEVISKTNTAVKDGEENSSLAATTNTTTNPRNIKLEVRNKDWRQRRVERASRSLFKILRSYNPA